MHATYTQLSQAVRSKLIECENEAAEATSALTAAETAAAEAERARSRGALRLKDMSRAIEAQESRAERVEREKGLLQKELESLQAVSEAAEKAAIGGEAESQLQTLRNELEGWRLVASEAQDAYACLRRKLTTVEANSGREAAAASSVQQRLTGRSPKCDQSPVGAADTNEPTSDDKDQVRASR